VFKDGAAWLRYNEKYGEGSPFDAIISHIGGMARDIAMMERFGPNPAASWRRGMALADAGDAASDKAISGAVAGTSMGHYLADKQWRYMNGDYAAPVFPDGRIAGAIGRFTVNGLASTRDIITAAFLGSAQITALSDMNTQLFRRKAIRLGLGARDATRSMLGLSRFYGETHGPRWSQIVADDVLRLSGINKWTEEGQHIFGMHYLGQLADERGLGWADLPEARRQAFDRHGIDAKDWDVMRRSPVDEEGGAAFMAYDLITDEAVSDKMMDMVLAETRIAVQEADPEALSMMRFGRPGTAAGELGANITQFKSFPLALLMNQARRVNDIARRHGAGKAGIYAAQFAIGMTLFGALTLQVKEMLKGRDMRPMDDPDFIFDAFLQGGGAGIFGDLIGSLTNDRLNSIYNLAGGPMVGLAEDLKSYVESFIPDEEGAETNPGKATVRMVKRYMPGTTLWYARAAFERLLFDQLAEEIDPTYYDSQRRLEESAAERGQEYYWRPGDLAPERLPTMAESPE
jgi:hypothetical protein